MKSAKEGSRIADELTSRLSSFATEEVPRLVHFTKIAIGTNEIAESIKRLLPETTVPAETRLREQSKFVDSLALVIENFIGQIKQANDPYLKDCVLLTLNRYLFSQTEILRESEKRVISRFSTVADIGKELVNSTYPGSDVIEPHTDNREFYGLMVIPQKNF